jgi:hypothetical protein
VAQGVGPEFKPQYQQQQKKSQKIDMCDLIIQVMTL